MLHPTNGRALSDVLFEIAADTTRPRISLGQLLQALDDRALGALLLIFSLPCVIPMPPGTSTVLGTPLVFLTAQLALALAPWLPQFIAKRSIARTDFATVVARMAPWLARAESLLKPRLLWVTCKLGERFVGLVCLYLAIVLVLPIPLGNMLPALAISLMALGVLERDGIWVIAGLATAVAATALIAGVLVGMIKAGLYVLANLF